MKQSLNKFIKVLLVCSPIVCLASNAYANKNYTWWCSESTCGSSEDDPWIDTQVGEDITNHYTICCGTEGYSCNQPSSMNLHADSSELIANTVAYCNDSYDANNAGMQFKVGNANLNKRSFKIYQVVCTAEQNYTINHDGFADTSDWSESNAYCGDLM